MASNPLINEFASMHNDLARRLAEKFDSCIRETDDAAAEELKGELELILEERTDALDSD